MSLIQIVVIVYVAYAAIFFMLQRRLIFPGAHMAHRGGGNSQGVSVDGLERLWLTTSVGRVEAWYVPAASRNGSERVPAVIFMHGNAEFIDDWPTDLNGFRRMGMSLLLVEYPGYGRSEGMPSQRTVMEAVTAGYDWLVDRSDIDSTRIVTMGRSLGGGPAVALAEQRSVRAIILQSPFSSVGAIAWSAYRLPPFLVLDRFDNRRALASFEGPVLIVHGRSDEVIPHKNGVILAEAAENAELITLECRHSDCPPSWDDFFADVGRFLAQAGILTSRQGDSLSEIAESLRDEARG